MRAIFMGTPDFAVPSLERLIERHEVIAVYCQPDKPKGRGHKMLPPPVKEAALMHGIPVYQPEMLKADEEVRRIEDMKPEVIVVVAYGKLLPKAVLDIPKLGCINVHGSLLPKYRGAAPIQWAVINGDKISGVTTMYMNEGMDTGDMILKRELEIAPCETAGELFDKLKTVGAELLSETLGEIESGTAPRTPQSNDEATLAPMLKKEDGLIDFTKTAEEINNLIRGLNPWPSAYAFIDGVKFKVHSAEIVREAGEAGQLCTDDGEMKIYCGKDALLLKEIQPENSKRMSARAYLLGHDIKSGKIQTESYED